MRFSFVPPGSRTPRRFQCAGERPARIARSTLAPLRRPGLHAAAALDAPRHPHGRERRERDGRTHELYQPQRETNLRIRLDEYLRYGLEAGFFYAT